MGRLDFIFDDAGIQALELLIVICDKLLGPRIPATRELRNLLAQRSSQASAAFNALNLGLRSRIADQANEVARQYRNPSVDVRERFPELFKEPDPEPLRKR